MITLQSITRTHQSRAVRTLASRNNASGIPPSPAGVEGTEIRRQSVKAIAEVGRYEALNRSSGAQE
jgi:hypothetical protein